jgi:hypothetical protein
MMKQETNYWFLAKRYGWGWGLPVTWQGWLATILYVVALVITVSLLSTQIIYLSIALAIESGLMILVCYLKGEPPSWHWGDK